MSWREILKKLLVSAMEAEDKQIILIGVGNPIRGDDLVGVKIARELKSKLKIKKFKILIVEDRVDLIPSFLRGLNPGLILIFDAADFGGKPGEIKIMSPAEFSGKTISTHELPLDLMLRLAEVSAPAYVVGIQISNLRIGETMNSLVEKAAEEIVEFLLNILH